MTMKILLLNPPSKNTLQGSNPDIIDEERGYNPSLGMLYIAASIREYAKDHELIILDSQVEELSYKELHDKIEKIQPDLVGMTVMTFTMKDVLKTSKMIKEINSKITIVFGGPHVNLYPNETIKFSHVDFLVMGEGERSFVDLVNNINNKKEIKKIKGLVYKDGNKIIHTPMMSLIKNLDSLPIPARDLTLYKKYGSLLAKRFPVTTMFTSRGCPYKSYFCDRPHLGSQFRFRSAKSVFKEFKEIARLGIQEVLVYDDTFTINRQRVVDICKLLIKAKLNITWDIRARVNTVDWELLKLLKKAGCERIHFGVESGNERILKVLRKGITKPQVRKAFALARKAGISTLGYFMIGSPTETKSTIMQTINFAKNLKCDFAHFTITTPYPGTQMYKDALSNGAIKEDVWRKFAEDPNYKFKDPIWNENFSREELSEFVKLAYKSFYSRPLYILERLLKIRTFYEFKTKLKAGIKVLSL